MKTFTNNIPGYILDRKQLSLSCYQQLWVDNLLSNTFHLLWWIWSGPWGKSHSKGFSSNINVF
jgi:hypothetical protein